MPPFKTTFVFIKAHDSQKRARINLGLANSPDNRTYRHGICHFDVVELPKQRSTMSITSIGTHSSSLSRVYWSCVCSFSPLGSSHVPNHRRLWIQELACLLDE